MLHPLQNQFESMRVSWRIKRSISFQKGIIIITIQKANKQNTIDKEN